jgi:Oxidoreductase family, C-terminal alpha/beta domain/Oxidoreductase family, NAD-binding Rossmann fold
MSQQKIGRRKFLSRTGAALGAAISVPTFIPASVLGRNGAIPPSERITMGFIGVGTQGGGHLFGGAWTYVAGGYSGRKDVQVLAVCDIRQERRESAAQRVNDIYRDQFGPNQTQCQPYNDFREVLDRDDIDAVLIATPAHWHGTMASMAAKAGKDMYCEKPSAVTVGEALAMRAAVLASGRVYQAGTQQRSEYGGKFRQAAEFVRSGRIGKLKEIYAYRSGGGIHWPHRFGNGKPIPDGVDWDMYLGPVPYFPFDGNLGSQRFDIGELNWGQHHYDIIQWTADADNTGPAELFMMDDKHTAYKYPNGVVVYGKPYPGEPVGGDGGACFVGTHGRIAVDRDSIVSDPPDIVREPLLPNEVHLYHTTSHSGNFLECVRTRQKTICPAEVAARSACAMLLGGVCMQLNRPLKWDPVAEKFIGDDEATRLCTIAKRAPWNV